MRTESLNAIYAKIDNRPGSLEHLTRIIKERRANINGVGLETVGSTGFVRLCVLRVNDVADALRKAGIEAHESEFVAANVPNEPGTLYQVAAELAAARVNIESVVTLPDGRLAFRTNDNDTAARIIGKL